VVLDPALRMPIDVFPCEDGHTQERALLDGDRNIYILTNLPKCVFAKKVAELYRNRWTIETAFKDLTVHLRCEINTLRYPPAALLGFCVALIAYITLAVWRSR
jgi:IS4 transposase